MSLPTCASPGIGMVGVIHANGVQDAIQRFCDRVDFSVLPQIINTVIFVEAGRHHARSTISSSPSRCPAAMSGEMHIRPVTTVTDHETGELVLDVFRYDGETIVIPVMRRQQRPRRQNPRPPRSSSSASRSCRPSPCGHRSAEHATEGERRPARLETHGEGDPAGDRAVHRRLCRCPDDERHESRRLHRRQGRPGRDRQGRQERLGHRQQDRDRDRHQAPLRVRPAAGPAPRADEEFNLGGGIKIQTDKKQLTIVAPEQSGRIVDVFAGKEYLFTATVNETGEIHLAKNSSIAQEMIRRYTNNEVIKLQAGISER